MCWPSGSPATRTDSSTFSWMASSTLSSAARWVSLTSTTLLRRPKTVARESPDLPEEEAISNYATNVMAAATKVIGPE